jgi:hypothetical protein
LSGVHDRGQVSLCGELVLVKQSAQAVTSMDAPVAIASEGRRLQDRWLLLERAVRPSANGFLPTAGGIRPG